MKNKLNQFNTKDSVLVLTSYPDPSDSKYGRKEFNAVGWHSTKTLNHLAKYGKVLICAEKRQDKIRISKSEYRNNIQNKKIQITQTNSNFAFWKFGFISNFMLRISSLIGLKSSKIHPWSYTHIKQINKNLVVTRIWEKGNVFSFIKLFQFIIRQSEIRAIFVQFEFNVYGGIIPNLALLMLLGLLRLFGRKVTFEMHQVITDIRLLAKHINITHPVKQQFFNFGLKMFYRMTGVVAHTIVVFEEELKQRLVRLGVKEQKVEVLSLSIDKKPKIERKIARNKIGIPNNEFVLMIFGFINGYKGIDRTIEFLKKTRKINNQPFRLLIAGGENPYLKDKESYRKFYNSIAEEAAKYPHVTHTGFIPEEDIHLYFSAADLVVLPYEVFMSASGPFSLSLSYGSPFILSEALSDYSRSNDFKNAMQGNGLVKPDVFFPLQKRALLSLVKKAQSDTEYKARLTNFASTLGSLRESTVVVGKLHSILHRERLKRATIIPTLSVEV